MKHFSYVGQEIKRIRKSKGLTLKQVAKALGTQHPQLSRYEQGHAIPNDATLKKILVQVFELPDHEVNKMIAEWKAITEKERLLKIEATEIQKNASTHFAPVFSSINNFLSNKALKEEWIIPQKAFNKYKRSPFAFIKITDNTMLPIIAENDFILISIKEHGIENGKFYLIKDGYKTTVRKVNKYKTHTEIIPENREYSAKIIPTEQEDKISVIGKVILVEKLID